MNQLTAKIEGSDVNFTYEKRLVESYTIRTEDGRLPTVITISPDGRFNAQGEYGHFAYQWGAFGYDFKKFLADTMLESQDYLYNKIANRDKMDNVDMEQTVANIRKLILKKRREAGLNAYNTYFATDTTKVVTEQDARDLWGELDELPTEDITAEHFFAELGRLECLKSHIIPWETFVYNEDELIVYTYDREARAFCTRIAPAFGEILKKEVDSNGSKSGTQSSGVPGEGTPGSEAGDQRPSE